MACPNMCCHPDSCPGCSACHMKNCPGGIVVIFQDWCCDECGEVEIPQ